MLIDIIHTTHYTYDGEVAESAMEARLGPRTDTHQRITSFYLTVEPTAELYSYTDGFGNLVYPFTILQPHRNLTLIARTRVETLLINPFEVPDNPFIPDAVECWPFRQFVGAVQNPPEVRSLAARFGELAVTDALAALQALMHEIHETFEYQSQVTSVSSTVSELLALRKGVCQDFAHLMIAVCRSMGIPARYVSGYIFSRPERSARGGGASHAWCEALVPGHGWCGFDPTNDVLAADAHVKVAIGRDYHDVPPTRGLYRGLAQEHIAVSVETLPVGRGA